MKIDKVILASNNNKDYLDFWPIVSEAWLRMDIEPVLIYTGKEKIKLDGNVINFHIDGIDPVFVAQNIRILAPALFEDKNSITSDIDDLPLSKKYFVDNVKDIPNHMFVIYRWGFITETMVPICWTLANGKVWKEIFNIKSESDIVNKLINWYPLNYKREPKLVYRSTETKKIYLQI